MMNLLKVSRFLIVLCTLLTMSLMANAAETLYPGYNCRYYSTQGSDYYFNPSGYGAAGLKNTSGSSRYVACPLYKSPGANVQSAGIYITTPSIFANCYLYHKYYHGGSGGYWGGAYITDYGYSWRYYFSGPYNTYVKTVTIYCSIPSNGVIYSYYHYETF